ncbi:dipeptidase [Thermococcus sp.]|uniref:dipeptidase n=1 Tax=Thermococcus sp. TaxID=35749 RepID=UPI0026023A87|nr:dipeptidase [Thermococcus sp.]
MMGVFDAHSDLPTLIWKRKGSLREGAGKFFGDWVSARVMAVWTPPDKRSRALGYGIEVVNRLRKEVSRTEGFEIVTSVGGMDEVLRNGGKALWIGMEGGEPLESLDVLEVFYSLGLRVLTLTWSLRNMIGDGVFERTNGGLTNFGVEVVGKAEELGILLDLSHINEAGFWDTLEVTAFPVIASHSNARALCDHPRNLTDEQIKAIAERGGVIGAVAIPSFVDRERPTLDRYVEHIEHMIDTAGYRHVGFGFDFIYYLPGWNGKSIEGFENESRIPVLLEKLGERLSEREIRAVAFENFRRVFERVIG